MEIKAYLLLCLFPPIVLQAHSSDLKNQAHSLGQESPNFSPSVLKKPSFLLECTFFQGRDYVNMNVGCYICLSMIAITICAILYIFKLHCADRGKKRGGGYCFSIVDSMKSKILCSNPGTATA